LVWQQLEQYMISVPKDLVKQFVLSFVHQRRNLRKTSLTEATWYTSMDKGSSIVPVRSGGEAPPGWCSVSSLVMITAWLTVCNAG